MNIHPVLVHFPIALMTIYAIAELIQYKKLKNTLYIFYTKAILVITGTLFAFLSLSTGEIAEGLYARSYKPLIDMHANFATATTYIFGFIALIYLISWINKSIYNSRIQSFLPNNLWIKIVNFVNYILNNKLIMISLSIVGLIVIIITGSLGGAIVYKPNVDPIVNFIYHLFF